MAQQKTKTETFALVNGQWFLVDRVRSGLGSGWFLGVGAGFDIRRLLVHEDSEGDALETVEESWPDILGEKVAKRDEDDGAGTFWQKGRLYQSRELRILKRPTRVERGVSLGAGDARLKNGELIRYT